MNALVHRGLLTLSLRRNAAGAVMGISLALACVLLLVDWSPSAELLGGRTSPATARALARQGIWSAFLLVLGPILVLKSAGTVTAWRRGEVDWLASSPATPATILLSTWGGAATATALVLALAALCAELDAGSGPPAKSFVRKLGVPPVALLGAGPPVRWRALERLSELEPGSEIRAHLILAGGGPTADVRFAARREGGPWNEVRRRIATRTALALELPRPGPLGETSGLELELERIGDGSVVVLDSSGLDLLAPVSSERHASLVLWIRSWLALTSMQALALGLGAWVSTASAALLLLSISISVWLAAEPTFLWQWLWPWHALPDALSLVGEGLVPSPPHAATWLGGALACALGLALGTWNLRTWRRTV